MQKSLFACFCFLLMSCEIFGAELKLHQIPFPEEMVTNRINCISSSSDGMVWIGTPSGICRFDGNEFVSWQSEADNPASLLSNYVLEIAEDPRQYLWIRTDMGFSRFDLTTETFCSDVPALFESLNILSYPSRIISDPDGNLWFYVNGNNASLYLMRPDDTQATLITNNMSVIGRNDISGIDICGQYLVLVSRLGEIILVDRIRGTISGIFDAIIRTNPNESEFRVYADRDGLLWIWSSEGVWLFDLNRRQLVPAEILRSHLNGLIDAVMQDIDGRIWVAQNHRGVLVLEKDPATSTIQLSSDYEPTLTTQTVTSLYQTPDNTVWIGTYKLGLYTYNQSIVKFDHYDMADVNVICRNGIDKAWIGTDSRGLWEWDILNRKAHKVIDHIGDGEHSAIVAIEDDGNGGCYIGTYGNGLIHYSNGKWTHWRTGDGLMSNHIWALLLDGDQGLWVGTLGAGLQYIDFETGKMSNFDASNSALGNNYISSLAKDASGNIYISTDDGISILNPQSLHFEYLKGNKFSNGHINQLLVDHRGLVWLATRGGVDIYNPLDKSIKNIDLGLASTPNALGIVEDADNNIWVTVGSLLCNVVVRDIKNDDYNVHVFNYHDGLTPGDFNQRSMDIIGYDILVAGSLYGLSYASPRYIKYNVYEGNVGFTALAVNGNRVTPGEKFDDKVIIDKSMRKNPKINIYQAKDNTYTIYFSTDNYVVPQKTQYFYRLGDDRADWTKCPPGVNFVTFAKLAPGNYDLYVKAVNSDGIPVPNPAHIEIVVHPPFWASSIAIALYGLIALALIVLIIWLIKHYDKRRYLKKQYQQELERQQHLNQMKLKFFTNISHELRTPLTLIITPIEDMIRQNNNGADKGKLDIIYRNAQHLLNLVNQILDLRKCEINELQLNQTVGDIIEIGESNIQKIKPLADSKCISLDFVKSQPKILSMIDVDKTNKIIANLLSNAIKFTHNGGCVVLSIEALQNQIIIKVTDTGIGISDKDKANIFKRFYQADQNTDNSISGTGIGLNMVWEYVKACKGMVSVSDNPQGKGSVFTVCLPLIKCMPKETPTSVPDADKSFVLIVDDNPDILTMITDHLSNEYNVLKAVNGQEAYDILQANHVDLIISDIMMPVMDGIELCRLVKSNSSTNDIPFVLLTAKSDIMSKLEGLTLGADDYLTKPFNMEELKLRIKNQLKLSHAGMKRMLLEPSPAEIDITSADEKLVEKAVKYVEENMDKVDFTVEKLSIAIGMSRTQLYKKLLSITGKAPLEFIRILRLKRAAQMLRESQMNVSEIAFATGFGTPKYFSRYFKEEFGMLPSQYQKTYKTNIPT